MIVSYTKESLRDACENSTSYRQVLIRMGRCPFGGGSYDVLKRKIKEYGIDTSHFLGEKSNCGENHKGGMKQKYKKRIFLL